MAEVDFVLIVIHSQQTKNMKQYYLFLMIFSLSALFCCSQIKTDENNGLKPTFANPVWDELIRGW